MGGWVGMQRGPGAVRILHSAKDGRAQQHPAPHLCPSPPANNSSPLPPPTCDCCGGAHRHIRTGSDSTKQYPQAALTSTYSMEMTTTCGPAGRR